MRRQVHGILLLDKPKDLTSNSALQRAKRLFNAKKAGHTGSLDPLATGMLPICFGEATKFSQFLLESDKSYYVSAKLGEQTTTGDSEGDIIAVTDPSNITREDIEKALTKFLGEIEQIPPMYSAIKHQGVPLYTLARKGIYVERKARRIKIFSLRLDTFTHDSFTFKVHCTKGTYVRTLVEDIGLELGCGAHVNQLRRITVMPYGDALMYTLAALEVIEKTVGQEGLTDCLLPVESSVGILPIVELTSSAAFYLRMGQTIRTTSSLGNSLVRLVSEDKKFLGVGEVMGDGRLKPHRLL